MTSSDQKIKTNPAPKKESSSKAKDKSTSGGGSSKAEGGQTADASHSKYSRGEGQKPVSKAYKDNWPQFTGKKINDSWRNAVTSHNSLSLLKSIFGLGICLPVRIATGDYLFAE